MNAHPNRCFSVYLQRGNAIVINLQIKIKKFKNGLKMTLKSLGIDIVDIEIHDSDLARWHTKVWSGVE